MPAAPIQFDVRAPAVAQEGAFTATVVVPIQGDLKANQILHYIRSIELKNDFMNRWVRINAPNYGIEIRNGPRPVFQDKNDRSSQVVAYEQDFRLTRPL